MTTIIFAKKLLKLHEKNVDLAEYIGVLIDKLYNEQEGIKGE